MLQYVIAEHPLFALTGAVYALSAGFYAAAWRSTQKLVSSAGTALMTAALLLNLGLICLGVFYMFYLEPRLKGRTPAAANAKA